MYLQYDAQEREIHINRNIYEAKIDGRSSYRERERMRVMWWRICNQKSRPGWRTDNRQCTEGFKWEPRGDEWR